MNYIDFCFWLQGYFELSNPDTINAKTLSVIENHLKLAISHQNCSSISPPPKCLAFCKWLKEHVNGLHSVGPSGTQAIKGELNDVFLHEIDILRDKETTLSSVQSQAIHDGEINHTHYNGKTSCSLESIVKGFELKKRINAKLEELGYTISEHSDYRGSYYNVSW